jgi:DNA-binding NtrC family response regulator
LLAEDERTVRNFVAIALQREKFVILPTCNGTEALQVFRSHVHIDLLLTDVQMGDGMSGIELAERIREEKPGTKVLVMSGFPENNLMAAQKKLPFLKKPFTPAILTEAVRDVLGSKIPAQSETKTRLRKMTG